MIKFSIITVVFNAESTIADTIRSVAAQSYPHVEHIVVDGASTDATVAVARSTPGRVSTLISEPDDGLYHAMNKGIALATGDVIGFLNADDFYASTDVLECVAAQLQGGTDSCYGDLCYVAQDDVSRVVRYWKSSNFAPGLFQRGWAPPHPTFFVKRSVYERLGGFKPEFGVASDVELMARYLEKARISTRYVPKILVNMRLGGASNRSLVGILRQNWQVRRALHSIGVRFSFVSFALHKIVSRGAQFIKRPS